MVISLYRKTATITKTPAFARERVFAKSIFFLPLYRGHVELRGVVFSVMSARGLLQDVPKRARARHKAPHSGGAGGSPPRQHNRASEPPVAQQWVFLEASRRSTNRRERGGP